MLSDDLGDRIRRVLKYEMLIVLERAIEINTFFLYGTNRAIEPNVTIVSIACKSVDRIISGYF